LKPSIYSEDVSWRVCWLDEWEDGRRGHEATLEKPRGRWVVGLQSRMMEMLPPWLGRDSGSGGRERKFIHLSIDLVALVLW
jgi:hypothetical protein